MDEESERGQRRGRGGVLPLRRRRDGLARVSVTLQRGRAVDDSSVAVRAERKPGEGVRRAAARERPERVISVLEAGVDSRQRARALAAVHAVGPRRRRLRGRPSEHLSRVASGFGLDSPTRRHHR